MAAGLFSPLNPYIRFNVSFYGILPVVYDSIPELKFVFHRDDLPVVVRFKTTFKLIQPIDVCVYEVIILSITVTFFWLRACAAAR